jgi:hypothetical protein
MSRSVASTSDAELIYVPVLRAWSSLYLSSDCDEHGIVGLTMCISVQAHKCFGETYRFHLQGRRRWQFAYTYSVTSLLTPTSSLCQLITLLRTKYFLGSYWFFLSTLKDINGAPIGHLVLLFWPVSGQVSYARFALPAAYFCWLCELTSRL